LEKGESIEIMGEADPGPLNAQKKPQVRGPGEALFEKGGRGGNAKRNPKKHLTCGKRCSKKRTCPARGKNREKGTKEGQEIKKKPFIGREGESHEKVGEAVKKKKGKEKTSREKKEDSLLQYQGKRGNGSCSKERGKVFLSDDSEPPISREEK